MRTEILKATEPGDVGPALERAVEVLRGGGLVAFPTETVYGLAARADIAEALERLAQVKERPGDKPFTLHIGHKEDLSRYVARLGPLDRGLLRRA